MKTPKQVELWNRIATFRIDEPDAEFPFSKKLAKENNWTEDFTLRAIVEYKKFLFLCATLPEGASPSNTVDKVWHLHLTYTVSYWNDLCPDILGFSLHHYPSKGGTQENIKHQNWYRRTLEKYINIFEDIPPSDIWDYPLNFEAGDFLPNDSPLIIRSTPRGLIGEIHPQLQPNQSYYVFKWVAYALLSIITIAVLYPPLMSGGVFIQFYVALAIISFGMWIWERDFFNLQIQNKMQQLSDNISPYYAAWLQGKQPRVALTALYAATETCNWNVETFKINFTVKKDSVNHKSPLLHILQALENGEVSAGLIKEATQSLSHYIEHELIREGLLSAKKYFTGLPILLTVAVIGFIRVIEGLVYGKPIGFLVLTAVVLFIAFTIINNRLYLNSWQEAFTEKYNHLAASDSTWECAMGGLTILGISEWVRISEAIDPPKPASDGGNFVGGCGSGDSGGCSGGDGGCGGGCGGCGGCGGG